MRPAPHAALRSALNSSAGRFAVVGAGNVALGYVLFRALLRGFAPLAHPVATAQAAAYAVGIGISFVANRRWTFRSTAGAGGQLPRFLAAHSLSLVLSSALMQLGVGTLRLPVALCFLLVTGVTTVTNFTLQRFWVFPHAPGASTGVPS